MAEGASHVNGGLTFALVLLLIACNSAPTTIPSTPTLAPTVVPAATAGPPLYTDPTQSVDARVNDLLALMTLAEKIGQMTQVEKNSIAPDDSTSLFIGSL